jgi:choline dehydrogenase-like flavoprotein
MERADVVVIGSGYGGTVPATRLAAAGMSVVVLERGKRLATRDFRQSDDPRYLNGIVDVVVSSSNVAFRTGTMVGGASINMDGAHFRMPQKSFETKDANGRPYWPEGFSRAALDPYYARAEAMLRVRQFGWNEISRAGGLFGKMLDLAGASCERSRMNYTDCLHCGFCFQGCTFDKKMTLLHTYIPVAEMSGAEFRANSPVTGIEPSGTGYVVHYTSGGAPAEIFGQRVIVGCGGIHTPALLLRSRQNLPNLSAQLGENFNNNGEHTFVGILPPEFDDLSQYRCYKGMDNAGLMTFHWYDSEGFTIHPGGGFEPSVFAADFSAPNHPVLPSRPFGMEFKRFVETVYPHRVIGFSVLGIADGHRAVVTKPDGTVDLADRDRTAFDTYLDRVEGVIADIGRRTGVTLIPTTPRKLAGTTSAHLLSACRMAESAQDGVVDPDGQVFGYENLYVCDASSMPYALGVNPALTITAFAERTAEGIIAKG